MKISHNFWTKVWYGKSRWVYLLLPLSWVFAVVSGLRKFFLVRFLQKKISVPVIIVGNISVGGTGKTPLIIELVKYLQRQGFKPGVISRGYGGESENYPYLLNDQSQAAESGDEPLLIYYATHCDVCVSPDRVAAALQLVDRGCTHILSDDGLQHYRLGRSLEIAVIDGQRLFGNKQLLPVGPLRESISRLNSVNLVVVNNPANQNQFSILNNVHAMKIEPVAWRHVASGQVIPLHNVNLKSPVHAVAGIGNPERFFKTLSDLSVQYETHCFPDHYKFSAEDFENIENENIVMTEKDAIKCQSFAKAQWYSLIVGSQLEESFWRAFQIKVNSLEESTSLAKVHEI